MKWGDDNDYNEIINDLNNMKKNFVDKGIPVIIGEVGVLTEQNKEINSIREYLNVLFSLSYEYEGIMSCLWDTSNKNTGDMNFYNRETNKWYDEILMNNIIKISRGKYVKSSEYYIITNKKTIYDTSNNAYGDVYLPLDDKKPIKVVINATLTGTIYKDYEFTIISYDKGGIWFEIYPTNKNFKKQYDGTYICTFDVSNEDCNEYIEAMMWYGEENIIFHSFTVEFDDSFQTFDYKSYKENIIKNIY